MLKTIGLVVTFVLIAGMVINGSINPVPAISTVLKFFAGGMNAVVNDGKQEIIINMPEQKRDPAERGYQP